jgi:mono/diheme cytochrome c family protein
MKRFGRAILFGVALAAAVGCSKGGDDGKQASAANIAHGKQVFEVTCATCHAADGTGVKGLGKPLVDSEYVKKSSAADVVKMVIEGRPVDDPLNTTKIAMPPRGGNAGLSDADIADAVAYLRTLVK